MRRGLAQDHVDQCGRERSVMASSVVAAAASPRGVLAGRWAWLDALLYGRNERVELLKNVVLFVVAVRLLGRVLGTLRDRGLVGVVRHVAADALRGFFKQVKRVPFIKAKIDSEIGKILQKVEHDVAPRWEGVPTYTSLPSKGLTEEEINSQLDVLDGYSIKAVQQGKVSGAVYHGGEELSRITTRAYHKFSLANPLHPDIFPGVRKMEAEVVSMVVNMYNGGPKACGTTTSGGTESILMACKAMRDWARDVKGITEPEMVIPVSAHAAFDKAGNYFGIKVFHAPVDEESRKVNVSAVRRMITSNTIMIVGSAPSFPHGAIDDIQALAKIARRNKIGLHVDCCLGGFIVPFMEKAGFPIAPVDFRVDGVTTISCDTHKYGFAPKGSSVIMYASKELRHFQYFVMTDWPGGIYASPGIAGSRPGALLAACWTALVHMGEDGYVASTKQIIETTRKLIAGVENVPGVYVMGKPELSVLALGSKSFNILMLGAEMTKRGWNLNSMQYPPSVHISVTILTARAADDFIRDVREIAAKLLNDPNAKEEGMAAMYGMAAAIPDRSLVGDIARGFIDALYVT